MRSDSVWARDGNADEHELRVERLARGIVTISDDKMVRILSKPEAAKLAFMLIEASAPKNGPLTRTEQA
jgi:hypothetical protein